MSHNPAGFLLLLAVVGTSVAIDYGPTLGEDYAGLDYNVTLWHSPNELSPNHWFAAMKECEQYCLDDPSCCTWTYVTPEGGSSDPERCCLKFGVPPELSGTPTHWTGAAPRAVTDTCQNSSGPPYPGPDWMRPQVHWSPNCLHVDGWHDIAAALTFKGAHHVMQGCPGNGGWSHSLSYDLVHWIDMGINVHQIQEQWGLSPPCSGFLTVDDEGVPCAGFRQCSSSNGMSHPWDVPLELRCAQDANLTQWGAPEYIYDVFFNRPLPYDPVRPWQDTDGQWYSTIAMDGCNLTGTPCVSGGREVLWTSPKLHGDGANWKQVGPMFTSNRTVLSPFVENAWLQCEFVTPDFFGAIPGDPLGGKTRVFTNNVAGAGCCSGTTGYYIGIQSNGGPFVVNWSDPYAVGMIDWGAFTSNGNGKGIAGLNGDSSRGYSMARTLGSNPNQVAVAGRRIIIGWTGDTPACQSLPRDLSLSPAGELLQQFVPELQTLRQASSQRSLKIDAAGSLPKSKSFVTTGQQIEVTASFTVDQQQNVTSFGLIVLAAADNTDPGVNIGIDLAAELVFVGDRAGPLQGSFTQIWMHVIVDHSLIEVIVNNRTALTFYASPASSKSDVVNFFGSGVSVDLNSWSLNSI